MLSAETYREIRQKIDAEFEARKKDLDTQHNQAIEALHEAWPKMGGVKEALTLFGTNTATASSVSTDTGRELRRASNGSAGETVPMQVIEKHIQARRSESDKISQTIVKERILKEYPNAKVPSLRTAISHRLNQLTQEGELELIVEGKAGKPHLYRWVRRESSAESEMTRNVGEFSLRSGP